MYGQPIEPGGRGSFRLRTEERDWRRRWRESRDRTRTKTQKTVKQFMFCLPTTSLRPYCCSKYGVLRELKLSLYEGKVARNGVFIGGGSKEGAISYSSNPTRRISLQLMFLESKNGSLR